MSKLTLLQHKILVFVSEISLQEQLLDNVLKGNQTSNPKGSRSRVLLGTYFSLVMKKHRKAREKQ